MKILFFKKELKLFSLLCFCSLLHPVAMAWRSSGISNIELIQNLQKNGAIRSQIVFDAMKAVDRSDFSPTNPYNDSPQPIGNGQTISAPHMHAHALDILVDAINV
jgi:protein-L-isoaspartate(D-aspartate) O-methyltransferase